MTDPVKIDTRYTQDRELSWLRFNRRVMDEALDETVPLFERLKFAAIFTSNLDEFFMIRVGGLCGLALMKQAHIDSRTGMTPAQQLDAVVRAVAPLYKQRDKLMARLEQRLRTCNICRLSPAELEGKERKQAERWFRDYLRPVLSPIVVDAHHPFPHLPSKALSVALSLRKGPQRYFGLVLLPRALPPYLLLEEYGVRYVLTEQIVLAYASALFEGYQVTEACIISVTRSADISPEDDDLEVGDDFRQHMKKTIKKRARLAPVRLEIQGPCGEELTDFLCARLQLRREQVFRSKAPLAMEYVYSLERQLPPESLTALSYPPYTPQWPRGLAREEKILPQILRRDLLLCYPYHSMDPFLQLIREAGNDPDVFSIKITIYRLAARAKLMEYLAAAAENGKDVTVLMELRARFDEQNNIDWAERLEEAGCTVLYGFERFKVHAKLCLITRRERGRIQYITQVGTGNYNEKTARLYSDFCLMTANPAIGADAASFFQNMATSNLKGEYRQLLTAPNCLKSRLLTLIDREMEKARSGRPARIFIKVNSVTDRQIIDRLAQASQAGVDVTMNVRGICCLLPGVPELTEHIRVFSIVGRYLEHARIFIFGTGEEARVYLSSADLMTRNTERRVEIACPILSREIRRQLEAYVKLLCRDNEKAREMRPDGRYVPISNRRTPLLDAQAAMMASAARTPPPTKDRGRPGFPPGSVLERLFRWTEGYLRFPLG